MLTRSLLLLLLLSILVSFSLYQHNIIKKKDIEIQTLSSDIERTAAVLSERVRAYEDRIIVLQEEHDNEKDKINSRYNDANASVDRLRELLQKEATRVSERDSVIRTSQDAIRECKSDRGVETQVVRENVSGGRTEGNRAVYPVYDTIILNCTTTLTELAKYSDELLSSGKLCERSY